MCNVKTNTESSIRICKSLKNVDFLHYPRFVSTTFLSFFSGRILYKDVKTPLHHQGKRLSALLSNLTFYIVLMQCLYEKNCFTQVEYQDRMSCRGYNTFDASVICKINGLEKVNTTLKLFHSLIPMTAPFSLFGIA